MAKKVNSGGARPLNEGSLRNSQTKTSEYKPKSEANAPKRPTANKRD